jgi:hypothetical protein
MHRHPRVAVGQRSLVERVELRSLKKKSAMLNSAVDT